MPKSDNDKHFQSRDRAGFDYLICTSPDISEISPGGRKGSTAPANQNKHGRPFDLVFTGISMCAAAVRPSRDSRARAKVNRRNKINI
ncbi:hypothetical protein RRG08_037652 [Elysia crispata]|uniref:Uncharacterized protein n=1 Tax=Elysia crispata TaxID=231223 RepID=A0AAE1CYH7_9GAST|nr:hypothetical protein RRG08_037652 [Elysia crispata]